AGRTASSRCGCQLAGDRIRLRYVEGCRCRTVEQFGGQVARRCGLPAGTRRTQSPQSHRLHTRRGTDMLGGNFVPNVPEITVEYNTDVSRAIVSLISSGAANRTPGIRYIMSHGGGTITALAGRFLGTEASLTTLGKAPEVNSRLYHLRRFYYDT